MAKKLSRAEKIRRHLKAHPDMALKDVAAQFGTSYQVVYMIKRKMPSNPTPAPEAGDGYVYSWINTNALDEDAQNALAAQLTQDDPVNHPSHYKTGGIETIDFIEAKNLNYNMGNAVKYISRAEHKGNKKQDLEKAVWYLNREISKL
jgi:hypothetical protein